MLLGASQRGKRGPPLEVLFPYLPIREEFLDGEPDVPADLSKEHWAYVTASVEWHCGSPAVGVTEEPVRTLA